VKRDGFHDLGGHTECVTGAELRFHLPYSPMYASVMGFWDRVRGRPGGEAESGEPGGFVHETRDESPRVERDRSGQVLELDCPERMDLGPQRLVGSLAHLGRRREFISAAELIQKAKLFDDGLYAAVELAAHHGCGARPAKTEWLGALRMALGTSQGAVPLYAAARMLDAEAAVPERLAEAVTQRAKEFLANELDSKPISFYTWSAELKALFRHDRLLQGELDTATLDSLLRALQARSEIRAEYESYLGLIERLTNPLTEDVLRRALRALDEGREPSLGPASLLPASGSHETTLITLLYGEKPIPDDFDLMSRLIESVRSGSIDLRPSAKSGWYDHQLWSLEPMVVPEKMAEADHLGFTSDYRSYLEDLLRGTWAQARETHAKQLGSPIAATFRLPKRERPELVVRPDLSCEPLVTHYRRRADSYRVVRRAIEDFFGADACRSLHRRTSDGPVDSDLGEELAFMERLFEGAANRCEREIGSRVEASCGADDTFASWDPEKDSDLSRDIRMMVPVFYDIPRKKTKVWVVLGWTERMLMVSFKKRPTVVIRDRAGLDVTRKYDIEFRPEVHAIAFPQAAEVYVDRILDREEFRALCDQHGTREAILAAL
jgi:hypothetical protein